MLITKKQVTKFALSMLPVSWATALIAVRSRRLGHRLLKQWGTHECNERLVQKFGSRTLGGSFPDMVLIEDLRHAQIGPFLLGTYEQEISPWFERLRTVSFSQIVDVGCSFGYYAVGLAMTHPGAKVVAFDTDPWARDMTSKMARANNVGHVIVKGYCSVSWMRQNLLPGALIVSDCEGFEFQLLKPSQIENLKSATMVIEIHDVAPWSQYQGLLQRFEQTHDAEEKSFEGNQNRTSRNLDFLADSERDMATVECRAMDQKWLLLTPKNAEAGI